MALELQNRAAIAVVAKLLIISSTMNAKATLELFKETFAEWNEDKAPRLGAALAYYTIFSLAPLLVILVSVAGLFWHGEAQDKIIDMIHQSVSPQVASGIRTLLDSTPPKASTNIITSIIGIATLLIGAGGLFGQLQDALNTIWEVQPKPGLGFMGMLRARFLSFAMVLGTGFVLLVSLILSAAIAALNTWLGGFLPIPEFVAHIINLVISFAVITLLFAMIFKVLPDVEIKWHDVWVGAALTAFLFVIGKWALGLYLGSQSTDSATSAAGSLPLLLLWVYYAAQILFFGAEFTQVYANKYGSHIEPSPHAVAVTDQDRAQQGMPRRADVERAAEKADNPGLNGTPEYSGAAAKAASSPHSAQQEVKNNVEDMAAVATGVGIYFILTRLFRRDKSE